MRYYVGVIHKDEGSEYGISFPDFPGCVSAGASVEELKSGAEEALAGHLRILMEDGEEIPQPSSVEEIMSDPDFADGMPVLIPVSEGVDKTVRVNITLKQSDLSAIDRNAAMLGVSRSAYIARSAAGFPPRDVTSVSNATGASKSSKAGRKAS